MPILRIPGSVSVCIPRFVDVPAWHFDGDLPTLKLTLNNFIPPSADLAVVWKRIDLIIKF